LAIRSRVNAFLRGILRLLRRCAPRNDTREVMLGMTRGIVNIEQGIMNDEGRRRRIEDGFCRRAGDG